MTRTGQASGRGATITIELDRDDLLPGRLAPGRVRLEAGKAIDTRGLFATLVGTETWQYQTTDRDANGNTRTRTVTRTEELRRVPVQLIPAGTVGPGQQEIPFEIPVPSLGPASLNATVARMDWALEVKLDIPRGGDVGTNLPVRVLQPTALLRAGVVRVGQFALWEAADAQAGGAKASVDLEPMPLCLGAPFEGDIQLELDREMKLQEIRLELRVRVKATVASGLSETLTPWAARLVGPGSLAAGLHHLPGKGDLPHVDLPTVQLPHGRTDAELHLILARPMARDPHLVRDVSLCTTIEL
jgi:hypothetical protein